jgi:hypothetical protein
MMPLPGPGILRKLSILTASRGNYLGARYCLDLRHVDSSRHLEREGLLRA